MNAQTLLFETHACMGAVLLKITAVILTQLLMNLQMISLVNQLIWSKNYTKMEPQFL